MLWDQVHFPSLHWQFDKRINVSVTLCGLKVPLFISCRIRSLLNMEIFQNYSWLILSGLHIPTQWCLFKWNTWTCRLIQTIPTDPKSIQSQWLFWKRSLFYRQGEKSVIDAILPFVATIINVSYSDMVFENHRKSIIQHCERSELRFEWTKVN